MTSTPVVDHQLAPAALAGVQAAVALGAVVVLPLGLRLLDAAGAVRVPRPRSPGWPLVGAAAALALLLPRGPAAVGAAVPFAVATVVLLLAAGCAWTAPRTHRRGVSDVAVTVALGVTTVGALALVADRAGASVLGFDGDILLLTVPHMLFAGFGACLAAGLAVRAEAGGGSRLARAGAAGVTLGVAAVLVGYLVSQEAELVGTVVLTGGIWCATTAAWRAARAAGRGGGSRAAGAWAATAVAGSGVAMLLALWWAVGGVVDVPHPDLSWMVATHGALNALAVVLGSLVSLRLRSAPRVGVAAPVPARRTGTGEW
ncbi:YndJ family protein [Cellulomonas dongxiuzhuiae]|uniref:YndJ family protein n=1 Tax=Cellulomonas dongxiuzhuiae TaxID=2819979 RepID=A0ABX8GJB0_9CELL|nr:YndJ family protein [Cellulomonas dongxiuzhuiae]MBO3095007.1 YndJ family protein [Cellulomonas dongxiuzhuiae]QWC16023.1 YndJ family protein [Cellulomonas dongxiuzhuiae]